MLKLLIRSLRPNGTIMALGIALGVFFTTSLFAIIWQESTAGSIGRDVLVGSALGEWRFFDQNWNAFLIIGGSGLMVIALVGVIPLLRIVMDASTRNIRNVGDGIRLEHNIMQLFGKIALPDRNNRSLEEEIRERTDAEARLTQANLARTTCNRLLQTALEDISLAEQLDMSLGFILTIPWLPVEGSGAIFLTDVNTGDLLMIAHRNLSDSIKATCSRVAPGRCLCGNAAMSKEIIFAAHIDHRHDIIYNGVQPHGHYCVPIMQGESLLGVLNIYLTEGYVKKQGECDLLNDIAQTLARLIEHRRDREFLTNAKQISEEANRAKSEFMATMSHEIRTPINAIMGFSDLALTSEELSPRIRDYLFKIDSSSRSLLRIINDILDYSKIEAGKLDIDNVDFHLRNVFDHLGDLFRDKAAERGLELIISHSAACCYTLSGDYLRLEQILMNLISNAIKFTKEGEVEIGVEAVEQTDDRVLLVFSVRDTGIGLNQEQVSKLFSAFVQADSSTTRIYGGTGLGLAICKRLTTLMGGRIWVESQPDQGSVFRFSLPFGRSPQMKGEELIPPDDLLHTRVLVVDDNSATRKSLAKMLTFFGFSVTEAASGAEALNCMDQARREGHGFPLALVDWQMPTMNGLETAHRIRELFTLGEAGASPKLILMADFRPEEVIEQKVDQNEVNAILRKPINCSLLFDTIMEVFDKKLTKVHRSNHHEVDPSGVRERLGGANVLLVDDNSVNQQVAKEILEQIGLIVAIANHGGEAIRMVEAYDFDAVLMDIQMPVMDGYTATQKIRANARFKDLPIIAMTANALPDDREKSLAVGMNEYVSKPIDKKQLYDVLLRWIEPMEKRPVKNRDIVVQDKRSSALDTALLPMLPGIDVAAGLDRLNGNQKLFRSLLLELKHDFGYMVGKIGVTLSGRRRDDVDSALVKIHAIKGVAGNLAACGLFESARNLEQSVKFGDRDQWPTLLEVFEKNLAQVLDSIALLEEEEEPSPNKCVDALAQPSLDRGELVLLLGELIPLISRRDIRTDECLSRRRDQLDASGKHPAVARLAEQIEQFDFEGAMATVTTLAQNLNIPEYSKGSNI